MLTRRAKAVAAAALIAIGSAAQALTCSLHSSNSAIAAAGFSCDLTGTTIAIAETYTGTGLGSVLLGDLDPGIAYTVIKRVRNATGVAWSRMANEVLDPSGTANDALDPAIQPAFVPIGFSTSNDSDGLSFDQGGSIVRTSSAFASVFVDEFTDARDFLDFFNGLVNDGDSFTMQFGLLAGDSSNLPFLLVQRPNANSRGDLPEPSTMLLAGAALAAMSLRRRHR